MKKEPTKRVLKWLEENAKVVPSGIPGDEDGEVYVTKEGDLYITRVGMEQNVDFLAKRGITENLQSVDNSTVICVGFSPKDDKWYGWSHRAIYGFTVGSTCKKGNCHYHPANKEDFMEDCRLFWEGDPHTNVTAKEVKKDGVLGVLVEWTCSDDVPNKDMRGEISSVFNPYPDEYGKGEWTAETMEDAHRMACDFARGVS